MGELRRTVVFRDFLENFKVESIVAIILNEIVNLSIDQRLGGAEMVSPAKGTFEHADPSLRVLVGVGVDVTSNKPDENISGISKHARQCSGEISWNEPKILATFNDKKKGVLQRNLLVRESLEIRRLSSSTNGLNDPQLCLRTNSWDPILHKLRDS